MTPKPTPVKNAVFGAALAAALVGGSALAQSAPAWTDVPDRFQIDAGYFGISSNTVLRFNGGALAGNEVDFEDDLGIDRGISTFWVDGSWRLGRRHTLKLSYTTFSRDRSGYELQRDITWGGQVYPAGLEVTPTTSSSILGGYYRFAIVRSDRFELGPAIGIGHLSISAEIRATASVGGSSQTLDRSGSTGNVTGAVGGYTSGWITKRLLAQGDFLYIKVSPGDSQASVTDWRLGANYYFLKSAGLGVQYKYDKYRYDRGIVASELGGEVTYQGAQAFLSFRF